MSHLGESTKMKKRRLKVLSKSTLFAASLFLCGFLSVKMCYGISRSLSWSRRSVSNLDASTKSVSSAGRSSEKEDPRPYLKPAVPAVSPINEGSGVVSGTAVRVWSPHSKSCKGRFGFHFTTNESEHRAMIMVREAVIDFRHNSLREYDLAHPLGAGVPFRRVTVFMTASRGVACVSHFQSPGQSGMDNKFATAVLLLEDGSPKAGWRAEVDYILRDPPCRNLCNSLGLKRRSCDVAEWQLVVTLRGPEHIVSDEEMQDALEKLEEESALLQLNVPVNLASKNEKIVAGNFSVGFGCISGLHRRRSLGRVLPAMPARTQCRDARGSVTVVGGALWGYKRNNRAGRREVANFAARSLLGSVRFDTVAVPVITKYSVSEIRNICQDDQCVSELHKENDDFLHELALDVEDELKMLGVPKSYWERIALFPACRLGTDFGGFEPTGEGCKHSRYNGQGMVNDLSYTLFSPYHKWYASFDLDEFAVNEGAYTSSRSSSNQAVAPLSAQILFDQRLEKKGDGASAIQLGWFEFAIGRSGWPGSTDAILNTRNHTTELMRTGGLDFAPLNYSVSLNRSACWQRRQMHNFPPGKSAVTCRNNGFGTSIHNSLALKNLSSLISRQCTPPSAFEQGIALYHGSTVAHGIRFGNCAWRPSL